MSAFTREAESVYGPQYSCEDMYPLCHPRVTQAWRRERLTLGGQRQEQEREGGASRGGS